MIKKIEDQEVITLEEAKEKYRDYQIYFIITEKTGYSHNKTKGYVLYIFEKDSEVRQIPEEEKKGRRTAWTIGNNLGESPFNFSRTYRGEQWIKLS